MANHCYNLFQPGSGYNYLHCMAVIQGSIERTRHNRLKTHRQMSYLQMIAGADIFKEIKQGVNLRILADRYPQGSHLMQTFSTIIGTIILILVIALIITLIRYPKQILVDAPAAFMKISVERFLSSIVFLTIPLWLPIWFLDNQFKWGIFNLKFFRFFYEFNASEPDSDEQPDIEYPVKEKLEIDFEHYTKFFISSLQDSRRIVKSLQDNLSNINKKLNEHYVFKIGGLTVIRTSELDLYDFNLLIQCLDNDFKRSKNFGFAMNTGTSFFGITDSRTLNNIIGQTSTGNNYAFSLVNGQGEYLAINNQIELNSKYTTEFFDELIRKIPAGNKN